MDKFYELNRKVILIRRKRTYKNQPLIKELWKQNSKDWQANNRTYYLFYKKMFNSGIKINKKSYDRGEYEKVS